MTERRDYTTDDVIQRLQQLPSDAWDPPQAPALRIDFSAQPDAAPVRTARDAGAAAARRRERWAWLTGSLTLRPLTAGALASVLLLAGVAGGVLLRGGDSAPVPDQQVQLAALPGAPGATATAAMGGELDGMALKVSGLPASKTGEYYELWALNSPDDLAPIGTFRVGEDGTADVQFALGIDPAKYKVLDVSVERDDGNPGHSGDSLLRSEISSA